MRYNIGELWFLAKLLGEKVFKKKMNMTRGYDYVLTNPRTKKCIGYIHIYNDHLFNVYNCKTHKTYKYDLVNPSFLIFRDRELQDAYIRGEQEEIREFNKLLHHEVK